MDSRPISLITGASSGIGLALAGRLARSHRLILTGRRNASDLTSALPENATYIQADFSQPEKAVAAIDKNLEASGHERLDLLIVNAGTGYYRPAEQESSASIRETLDVNLAAPVLLAQRFYPKLEAARGKVVFIGSVAHRGAANMPSYAASKAGLSGLARSLESEWAGRVAVQIIHPGPARTAMHERAGYPVGGALDRLFFSAEAMAEEIVRLIDSGRPGGTIMLRARLRRMITGRPS